MSSWPSSASGSSPRMRGTDLFGGEDPGTYRFIPAHAGNSLQKRIKHCLYPVHPRACGEQRDASASLSSRTGSSPRMRGTVPMPMAKLATVRFIPAHAGNSPSPDPQPPPVPVHPRACGEQRVPITVKVGCDGSSPRMRGTVRSSPCCRKSARFIPAHAGNRLTTMSLMWEDLYDAVFSTSIPPAGDSR